MSACVCRSVVRTRDWWWLDRSPRRLLSPGVEALELSTVRKRHGRDDEGRTGPAADRRPRARRLYSDPAVAQPLAGARREGGRDPLERHFDRAGSRQGGWEPRQSRFEFPDRDRLQRAVDG